MNRRDDYAEVGLHLPRGWTIRRGRLADTWLAVDESGAVQAEICVPGGNVTDAPNRRAHGRG